MIWDLITKRSSTILLLIGSLLFLSCKIQEFKVLPDRIIAHKVEAIESPTQLVGPSVFQIPDYFVWGGSVVKGDDDKYHMLFSLWESGIPGGSFSKNWVLQSKIGYAVSDYPDRNFRFRKIVLQGRRYDGNTEVWDAQMVHNPHIKKFNDTYYLYYIGGKDPGEQPKGSAGENLDQRASVQQTLCIGVIAFNSFNDLLSGNFSRPKQPLLEPRTRVKPGSVLNGSSKGTIAKPDNIIVVNPSVVYNPKTKRYLLFFKGNLYDPHWKGAHGVAIGDTPLGPFAPKDNFIFDVRMPDGSLASTEDPYVWYVKEQDQFMAVVKDFTGRLTGQKKTLAPLLSFDGIRWQLAKNPLFMKRELLLPNGSVLAVNRLERSQLLLNKRGIPTVMYAACAVGNVNPKNDGSSFNVQIPLVGD
ncbi:glycoside hydrolase family protein [uncultured Kriegella sp.]|uniref:glycoside hydrolase family protein n=1 Tax=uncultured Kriegella sp. TaxID=1798910 RepID=UPI0030DB29DC|tara:strand:+ start:51432 stop:52670 length:1239 start_codon:yes stop_codon:yes gene_type:complete